MLQISSLSSTWMDTYLCANSSTEDFGCKYSVETLRFELVASSIKSNECSHNNMGAIFLIEDANSHGESGECETEGSKVEELEIAFEKAVLIKDDSEYSFGTDVDLGLNEILNLNADNICGDLEIHESNAVNPSMKKRFEKFATFPHMAGKGSSPGSIEVMEVKPAMLMQSQISLENTKSTSASSATYTRSNSLSPSLNLVSAMKGGREQQGQPSKLKLNVKWAPDVYDPPITLMSHTVKNHQQRPKPKKKDRNKPKNKGKSSRGSTGDRKHVRTTASNTDALLLSFQAPADKLLLDGFSQSGEEIMDYAVAGKESKCGSSFLVGSLAKMQEAS